MVVTLIEWEHSNIHFAGRNHTKKMKDTFVYCDECKSKYNLADPCIHHLPDSPEARAKYDAYKRKNKESKGINNQTKLDSP